MDLKAELKDMVSGLIKAKASPLFLERTLAVIEETPNEREPLLAASDRVSKMISLFINKQMGAEISGKLREKIDKGFPARSGLAS